MSEPFEARGREIVLQRERADAAEAQRDALAGTLRYLLAQAKNGTLHPQVVIQNAESALAAAAAVAEALGGKDGENNA